VGLSAILENAAYAICEGAALLTFDAGVLGQRFHVHPLLHAALNAGPELVYGQSIQF
jgi:hypothetical protein